MTFRPPYKKVFETVRSASRGMTIAENTESAFPRIGSMTTSTMSTGSTGPRVSSMYMQGHRVHKTRDSAFPSFDSAGQSDSEGSLMTDSEDYPYVRFCSDPSLSAPLDIPKLVAVNLTGNEQENTSQSRLNHLFNFMILSVIFFKMYKHGTC